MPEICNICGRPIIDGIRTQDGIICRQCYCDNNYRHCDACGEHFRSVDNHRICSRCEERVYSADLNPYSTKPRPFFKNFNNKLDGKDTGCRYYGMELEFNDSSPTKVHELGKELYDEKFIYNKSDASISSGVEVVTSPMDRRVLPKFLERMKQIFEYVGDRNYKRNAGLHIHVNKKSIDAIDRYKLNILLNTFNASEEKEMMYYLSGRQVNTRDDIDDHYFRIGTSSRILGLAQGHSVALNTSNKYTFEFRIFKSSNNPDEILSYVELVDKMIDFCHDNGIKDIKTCNFIIYLKANSKNKIILDKIKTFEKEVKEFKYRKRVMSTKEYSDKLHGIKWTEFYKVLSYMNEVNNIIDYCESIDCFLEDYKNGNLKLNSKWINQTSSFDKVNKLRETVRIVLLSRIKKQRKDNKKKCA